ncbi:MAG TPA: hypothetical protein VNG89_07065, partial [Vicinamibacterales bacterium]|nr:hypothetical protein [Vicinamibacterales bacterium]
GSTHFRMRMTFATSVLFFLRAEFEVQDVTTGQTAIYRFEGFGPSPGLAAGVTFSGPWNDFTTSVPLTGRDRAVGGTHAAVLAHRDGRSPGARDRAGRRRLDHRHRDGCLAGTTANGSSSIRCRDREGRLDSLHIHM